jgi:hypothetical protein
LSRAASRTKKLTSHFRALSLKAFWNWTAMRAQKPDKPGTAAGPPFNVSRDSDVPVWGERAVKLSARLGKRAEFSCQAEMEQPRCFALTWW